MMLKTSLASFKFYFKYNIWLIITIAIFFGISIFFNMLTSINQIQFSILKTRLNSLPGFKMHQLVRYVTETSLKLNNIYRFFFILYSLIFLISIVIFFKVFLQKRNYEIRSFSLMGKANWKIALQLLIELTLIVSTGLVIALFLIYLLYPLLTTSSKSINTSLFQSNLSKIIKENFGSNTTPFLLCEKALVNNKISMYNARNIFSVNFDLIRPDLASLFLQVLFIAAIIFLVMTAYILFYFVNEYSKRRKRTSR